MRFILQPIVFTHAHVDAPSRKGCCTLPQSGALLVGGSPRRFQIAGLTLLVVPWNTISAARTSKQKGRKRHGASVADRSLQRLPCADIVFSHSPPRGICDLTHRGHHIGSRALLQSIADWDKPAALWCFGHVHEQRGGVWVNLRKQTHDGEANVLSCPPNHRRREQTFPASSNCMDNDKTLCINASNANDGRASFWPKGRPPILIRIHLGRTLDR
jgi:hypothetical protein